jgi:hypothetical protein
MKASEAESLGIPRSHRSPSAAAVHSPPALLSAVTPLSLCFCFCCSFCRSCCCSRCCCCCCCRRRCRRCALSQRPYLHVPRRAHCQDYGVSAAHSTPKRASANRRRRHTHTERRSSRRLRSRAPGPRPRQQHQRREVRTAAAGRAAEAGRPARPSCGGPTAATPSCCDRGGATRHGPPPAPKRASATCRSIHYLFFSENERGNLSEREREGGRERERETISLAR